MPIYEYTCENCGALNEVIQSFNAPAPEQCEKCGEGPLHKNISKGSFVLKGGGWYNDGYTGPSNKSTGGGDSGTSSGDSGGDNGSASSAPSSGGDTSSSASSSDS